MKLKLRKPQWTEKRDSVRVEMECPLEFQVIKKRGMFRTKHKEVQKGLMLKPSLFGMRLSCKEPVPQGTELDITVELETIGFMHPVDLRGRVVWSDYNGKTSRYDQGVALHSASRDMDEWEKIIRRKLADMDYFVKSESFTEK